MALVSETDWPRRAKALPGIGWRIPAFAGLFALLIALSVYTRATTAAHIFLDDDAYYYKVVAENWARTGLSSFDGHTLTNGYHPLWQFLEAGLAATVGLTDALIIAIELCLATVGIAWILTTFRSRSLLFLALAVALFARFGSEHVGHGMETSLFLFGLGAFLKSIIDRREDDSWLMTALAAALTIGARIDSAVFIVPMLVAALGLRRSIRPLILLGVAGLAYAGVNQWVFGVPFPVSGAIKSLGGLQFNTSYLLQLAGPMSAGINARSIIVTLKALHVLAFVVAGIASGLALCIRDPLTRRLALGYAIGFVLFQAKLIFGSSWVIWSWYSFSIYIGLWLILRVIDERFAGLAQAQGRAALAVAVVMLAGATLSVINMSRQHAPISPGFAELDRQAAEHFSRKLANAPVAMGDRAGTFAAFYPGSVTQLEGLVNDRQWLAALQAHADMKAILCARGVRYLFAYQRDLGDYATADIPMMRHWLTGYQSPTIAVSRADEVERFSDLAVFDNRGADEGDSYLYVWRLTGCETAAAH